jgi:hypothetical protein
MARRRFIIPGAPFLNEREVLAGLADGRAASFGASQLC